MTFLVVAAWPREERSPAILMLLRRPRAGSFCSWAAARNRCVCAGRTGVLAVDDPLAAGGTPDRAHAGARRVVKAAAVVDGQPRLVADGLVDDQLDPVGAELSGPPSFSAAATASSERWISI